MGSLCSTNPKKLIKNIEKENIVCISSENIEKHWKLTQEGDLYYFDESKNWVDFFKKYNIPKIEFDFIEAVEPKVLWGISKSNEVFKLQTDKDNQHFFLKMPKIVHSITCLNQKKIWCLSKDQKIFQWRSFQWDDLPKCEIKDLKIKTIKTSKSCLWLLSEKNEIYQYKYNEESFKIVYENKKEEKILTWTINVEKDYPIIILENGECYHFKDEKWTIFKKCNNKNYSSLINVFGDSLLALDETNKMIKINL